MEDYLQQITYDENWQSVSEPEIPVVNDQREGPEAETIVEKRKKTPPKHLVLTVRLVSCLLIALAAFALKSIGGDAYSAFREWYTANLNQTVIFDGKKGFSLSNLFATPDETQAF